MRRAVAVPALFLAASLASCTNTVWMLKEPVREYSEGNYIWGTFMLACLPVMVPIFMLADGFALLNVSEQDVAVIAQAGQDYVNAKAAQEQAHAQAQAQAQALAALQQQQYQQQQQQQLAQQQRSAAPAPTYQPVAAPAPAPAQGTSAQDEYMERQRQQVAAANAQVQANAERQRQEQQRLLAQNAIATNCLTVVPPGQSLYGGFINKCGFKVNVTWCNDGATGQGLGNFSDAIDCRKSSFAAETVAANGRVGAHTNAPRVFYAACKSPFSPLDQRFTGDNIYAVCR